MWKTKIEMLLIRERLWLIVCQHQLCLTSTASSHTGNNATCPDMDAAALEWNENTK
jgi:hypothetical protein